MQKKRIVTIGEALIDFIPLQKGQALKDVSAFERVAGGAPANVAAGCAKLGARAAMVVKLGEDSFGDYIVEALSAAGVDTSYIQRTNQAHTGLAFAALDSEGERTFTFYRSPSADMLLEPSDLPAALFDDCACLHFCSVDLVDAPVKAAHREAIRRAREAGAIISFDPNIRLPLWSCPSACQKAVREFLPMAELVKLSDEELEFVTGYADADAAARSLLSDGCKMVLCTKGAAGAALYTRSCRLSVPAAQVDAFDTTGAGDSFAAAILVGLMEREMDPQTLDNLSETSLADMLLFASYYAAYTTMGKGAVAAMADKETIAAFIREQQALCPMRAAAF